MTLFESNIDIISLIDYNKLNSEKDVDVKEQQPTGVLSARLKNHKK
jgi:hypothetical protein